METKTVHLQFKFFTEFTSFLWSCVFLGSCKCFGTLFGQFLLVHSFHCIHRLALFFYCCWCWCCSSSSSVVFILLFIFLRLSRIDSNKTVQSWSINTCKIPQKYKSTNKLKRSDADTGVHTNLVMKSETLKHQTSKHNQTESERSAVNYQSKRSLIEAVLFPKYKKIKRSKIKLKVLFIRVYFLLLIE